MPTLRVNDYDLAYTETGSGTPILMIHGSLCDYRYWSSSSRQSGMGSRYSGIRKQR